MEEDSADEGEFYEQAQEQAPPSPPPTRKTPTRKTPLRGVATKTPMTRRPPPPPPTSPQTTKTTKRSKKDVKKNPITIHCKAEMVDYSNDDEYMPESAFKAGKRYIILLVVLLMVC